MKNEIKKLQSFEFKLLLFYLNKSLQHLHKTLHTQQLLKLK